jgi:hypothetical protein
MGKNYHKALKEHVEELARANLRRKNAHVKKGGRSFDLMLSCFEASVGIDDEDDKALRKLFRRAKLNVEDAFHWWELLHLFVAVHTNRPPGAHVWNPAFREKLIRDCVQISRDQSHRIGILEYCETLTDKQGPYRYRQTVENLKAQISRFKLTAKIDAAVRRARKK